MNVSSNQNPQKLPESNFILSKKQHHESKYKNPKATPTVRIQHWIQRWIIEEDLIAIKVRSWNGIAECIGIKRDVLKRTLESLIKQQELFIDFDTKVISISCCKFTTEQININCTYNNIIIINIINNIIYIYCSVVNLQHNPASTFVDLPVYYFDKNGGIKVNSRDLLLNTVSESKKIDPKVLDVFTTFEKVYFKKYNRNYHVNRKLKANTTVAYYILDFCMQFGKNRETWRALTPERYITFAFTYFYPFMVRVNGTRQVYFTFLKSSVIKDLWVNAFEWLEPDKFKASHPPRDIQIEHNRKTFMQIKMNFGQSKDDLKLWLQQINNTEQQYYEKLCEFGGGMYKIPYNEVFRSNG
jgi:hypothetical protein